MTPNQHEARWREALEQAMARFLQPYPAGGADGLYAPIHYLLSLGGKRIRPVLALAACEAEGGTLEQAMPSALAVELFHNFTLMHDDIMDQAPKRRGQDTVHIRWNENAGILSGDAMYTLAHVALSELDPKVLPEALKLFNQTALEVCLGQQSDMAFESRTDVTVEAYLEMIRLKTSVLVAASLALGAVAVGATPQRVKTWYELGEHLGMAFQMQDDLLDAFGDEAMGKQIGGDILADKKTFLRLFTWEHGGASAREVFTRWDGNRDNSNEKINEVRSAMKAAGAEEAAKNEMRAHVERAMACAQQLELDEPHLEWFEFLAGLVTDRTS